MNRKIAYKLFLFILVLLSYLNVKASYVKTPREFFSKLNYSSSMEAINKAKSSGDYSKAKDELLKYFKNKFSKMKFTYTGWDRHGQVYLREYNAISYDEEYLGHVIVDSDNPTWKTIDLGKDTSGVYVLTAIKKSTDFIGIMTKEHPSNSTAQLIITKKNGTSKTFFPLDDSYVRAGKYADKNFGTSELMYAKHSPSGSAKGSLPYSDDSCRSYIAFDIPTSWKSDIKSVVLKVKVKLTRKTSGVKVDSSIPLVVMNAYYTNWKEGNLTWNKIKNDDGLAHFSYNGIKGGFDWKKPEGSYKELFIHSVDFNDLMSLCKEADSLKSEGKNKEANKYYKIAKDILIDFIDDDVDIPNEGFRTAQRISVLVPVYNALIINNAITSEENYKILCWIYNDMENEIYNDKSKMFDGTKPNVTKGRNTAYTNWGVFYLMGYYSGIAYFKEFKDNNKWSNIFYKRLNNVYDKLIKDDGSLNEATLFYAADVISNTKSIISDMIKFSDNTVLKKLRSKIIALGRYVMLCAFPNGYTPNWGDNNSTSIKNRLKDNIVSIIKEKDVSGIDLSRLKEIKAYVDGKLSPMMVKFPNINIVTDRTGYTKNDSGIFMNAKAGGSHSHADALALLFYYQGRELLHDTGTTTYNKKHFHYDWQRNYTKSHNTIEINNTGQRKYDELNLSGSSINISGNMGLSTIKSYTKATEGFTHYRNITYAKELGSIIIVSDYVKPNNSKVNTYTQNWHSEPGTNSTISNDNYKTGKTNYSNGSNLIITQANNKNLSASIQKGYDSSIPASTTKYFEYTKKASGKVFYQTVLYPVKSGVNTSSIKIKPTSLISNDKESAIKIDITDSNNPNKLIYSYTSFTDQTTVTIKDNNKSIKTNAKHMLIAYDAKSKIHAGYLNEGSNIIVDNSSVIKASTNITDVSFDITSGILLVYSNDSKVKSGSTQIAINIGNQTVDTIKLNDKVLSTNKYSTKGNIITINAKSTPIKGDVNSDGKVNSVDYVLIRKHILGSSKLTGDNLKRADINGDGSVKTTDYIAVRKIILSK